ncbi:hypothetical protein N9L68_03925 [bacterium]|nr:hypothetical protein [bacterium]
MALQTALKQHTIMNDGNESATFDVNTGLLEITNDGTGTWHIATRSQLLSAGTLDGVSFGRNPQDANNVIGSDSNATSTLLTRQLDNAVMIIPFQHVYLTDSDFGMMNQSQGTN